MAELGERGAQNDHALRDQVVKLPWLGKTTIGPSGFRFVRIDNADPKIDVQLSQVRAILTLRDIPYVGSFKCSDERLNQIWQTGAYTVHLNMQDYLWDGIKRDRLVWLGDMHPEVSVINSVFGYNEVVPKSLDLTRDVTPVTAWMNGISSYSMWWILIHEEWYLHHGNLDYLKQQQPYLTALLKRLTTFVDADGKETLDGMRFLDWPTASEPGRRPRRPAGHDDPHHGKRRAAHAKSSATRKPPSSAPTPRNASASTCPSPAAARRPPRCLPSPASAIPRMCPPMCSRRTGPRTSAPSTASTSSTRWPNPATSTPRLDFISQYWGGMLDFGATTFWEDFDLDWTKNAGRIDEPVAPGKKDLHGDFGAHCYVGFRHSFCHGWAGGPTAWLSKNVLGVTPVAPGCAKVRITPASRPPRLGGRNLSHAQRPDPRPP